MPTYTNAKEAISMFRLLTSNHEKFDFNIFFKYLAMTIDTRSVTMDSIGLTEGEISIFDVKNFTFRHFWNVMKNFSTIRLLMKYLQEAIPMRISHSHYINCPPIFTRLVNLVKPLMKKELSEMLHFHSCVEALYEFVPKEHLPVEYGGNAGTCDEIFRKSFEQVQFNSKYLQDDRNWRLSVD